MHVHPKNFNLGYFLKEYHFEKAIMLLKKQLDEKTFTFRTIDLEIYRKEKSMDNFDIKKLYNNYIEKDLLYNYRSLFYNYEYNIPKGAYGIRKFNFTSFNLLVLYYALGFYFYEVLYDSLTRLEPVKSKLKNIKTFYGGNINFENPTKSQIYYQNDYSEFTKGIKESVKRGLTENKKICIIKLDIQDFYGSIKNGLLLEVIEKYSLPSKCKELYFNTTTKEAILNLLTFYNKKEYGLPLSTQNIVSNFISYIFLFELDNHIQNLPIYQESGFSYFRYVDDFFLIFLRDRNVKNDIIGEEIFEYSTNISDFLSNDLSLKINHLKSQNWIIEDKSDYENFLTKEKFISFTDPIKMKISGAKKTADKFKEVCEIIEQLKKDFVKYGKTEIKNHDDIALKEIFITSVKDYVKSSKAKNALNTVFENWNPILTLNSVKALMFLLGNSKTGFKAAKDYLLDKTELKLKKTQNIYLLEKFLKLETYDDSLDRIVLSITKNKSLYLALVQRMIKGKADKTKKYLPIKNDILRENDSLMQQIKMMVLAEEEQKFNVAFNHLLNTFHLLCYIKDSSKVETSLKKYNQDSIVIFLTKIKASIQEINFVMSFFDRRNKNNISHPGDSLMENWVVNKNEYKKYYKKMVHLIKRKISN
ncbi:hypothetical protein GCM10023149_53130 [Mucilaginibacter gynuensis]|uniref:Reverse transcriptase (RNA-dependent DNA polymerase) n=1 Tax=Mucilaginibacter gynuensis TaxID=1302236 RepID=A0ABP8HMB6_9SPHI